MCMHFIHNIIQHTLTHTHTLGALVAFCTRNAIEYARAHARAHQSFVRPRNVQVYARARACVVLITEHKSNALTRTAASDDCSAAVSAGCVCVCDCARVVSPVHRITRITHTSSTRRAHWVTRLSRRGVAERCAVERSQLAGGCTRPININ